MDDMDTLVCHNSSLFPQPDFIIIQVNRLLNLWVHYFTIENTQLDLYQNEQLFN